MRCPFRGLGRKRREQTHGQPSISGFVLLAKHLAVKNSGERRRLACPLKLKAEADPPAREKTQLEQSGFDLMMIEHHDRICVMVPPKSAPGRVISTTSMRSSRHGLVPAASSARNVAIGSRDDEIAFSKRRQGTGAGPIPRPPLGA